MQDAYTALEGRGAVTITVTLSADPGRSVTIPITVTGNGGADTSDYSLSATSVTINSGDTSATFTVTATDDDVYDGDGNDETLTLGFGTPPDAVSEGNQATATVSLIDNEFLVTSNIVPEGTAIGEKFRLLFLTNDKRNGSSSNISDYDSHIQRDITSNGSDEIKDYVELFRVLGSTGAVDARDHTGTTHTSADKGVPIWWVEGPKAADDYEDFYDGSWAHRDPGRHSDGDEFDFPGGTNIFDTGVYTGTRSDGTESVSSGSGSGLGRSDVGNGRPGRGAGSELFDGNLTDPGGVSLPFYGLSFVLRAAAPADTPYVTGVEVDPEPANGKYETNDTITVEVTFSEAVTVNGTPTFPLEIGTNTRDAGYQSISTDGMVLTFSYQVTDDDTDIDGISSTARTFDLPSTALITRLNESAVAAYLGPILLSTDFTVNAPPLITGIEVTSSPKADPSNDTYGLGEDIEIAVTFSEAVEVEGDVDFGISVSGPRRAPLKSGSGTTELVFAYTVQSGDTDANGIFIVDHTHSTNPTFDLQDGQSVVGVDSGRDALLEHDEVGQHDDHKVNGSLTAADATLSVLSLSGITLDQTFTAGAAGTAITSFTATTSLSATTVTATATQSGGSSAVVITPADADTNTTGHQVTLDVGDTVITVTVTSSNGDSMRTYTVTVTRQAATDTTAPAVDSAAVSEDGTKVSIVFDEALDTTGTAPAADAFDVTVDGGTGVDPASADFHTSDADTVVLTMSPAIAAGATVSVAYDKPTSNALADAASNEVADFTQTAPNRPAAPVVTLTTGNEKLTAAWTAPANGGSAITGYDVEWKTGSQTWAQAATAGQSDTAAADATDHEISGLTNGIEHTVRVRAANAAGNGPWSAEVAETPVSAITQVTVEFGAASYTATKGGTAATVTVNLSADPERSVTIPITATGNGGADTSDYSLSANSVTIDSGETSATFTVTATDDSVDDDGESVNLSFGTNLPDGVSEGTQRTATVSLTDNDGAMPVAVTVEFDEDAYTAIEGRSAVTITVNLSADPERSVTIPITATGNGGADTGDYSLSANSVTIDSGSTSATFTVTATDDDIYDGEGNDETLTLGFGTPPDAVSEGNQATATVSLLDNDIKWGSDLLPDDAEIGDEFRLLFVTSGEVYPTSSDIDVYNQFVQDATAGGHADIQDYSSLFRALASTASVSALDNTATSYTSSNLGVPIWWLNGANVADDYRDFYDDSWDQGDPGNNETGSEVDFSPSGTCTNHALVWTGSDSDGEARTNAELGDSQPAAGLPCDTGREIFAGTVSDTFDYPLYGLSYVLQAARPDGPYVTDVGVHFEPEDSADDNGVYVTGDTIRVAVTYSEDVVVGGTGTPTFPLQIGSTTVQAAYDADKSTADQLVFTHVVVAGEVDDNGISSGGNLLTLPSTASITAADDDTEDAYLGPLNLSTELDVNSAPRILDVEVTSTPQAASDTYGLGEDIEITVTFSQAVHLEGDVLFRFNTGNGQRQARLARGNDTKALVFAYTVKSGDEDDNGIFIAHPNHNNHPTLQLETDVPGQDDQTIVGVATGLDAEIEHASPPSSSLSNHKIDATETGADATLSALSLSGGITLDPVFSADTATTSFTTTSFTATTSLSSITVTATASQSGARADIDPDDADTNTTDHDVNLGLGDTVITVTVTSTNGDSMRTYTVTVTRGGDRRSPPPPPKNVRAVEEKGGVRLTWQPPDGPAVTGYRIERRPAGGQDSGPQRSHGQPRDHHTLVEDTGSADTGYTDKSAEQGVEYEYRVTARNESGPGEESDWVRAGPASASNNPATGAPTIRGTAQVGQTLTADTSGIADADGLSGETFAYQWVSSDGTTDTDIENATGSTYTLIAADQGKSVKVRVTFTDDGGNEETLTSAPTGPVWGDGLPGAPRNLTATPGNREVSLSWDPPDDNGNAPPTRYRIEWRVDGKDYDKNHWGTSRETAYTTNDQANLANGVKYVFRVKAENGSGNSYGPYGPASDEVSATPTSGSAVDLGTPVLSDTETLHHGMVRLDWEDIEDAGWYVVQYYHLEDEEWLDLPAEGVDIAFHGSSAVVSNLHGLSWLRVGAASCDGASEWSQIEELYGTNASDWEGVPVPEVEEGDQTEPCPVVLGTPVLSDTEILHHGMVQLDWQDIEDAGWYVVQYYHLEDGEWLDLPAEGVDIAFHGSSAVVSNLHGLSWLRVGAASCDGASEWSQIEELYGTNASDWEGVPVPEVAEGDEIEPCDEDPDTPGNSPRHRSTDHQWHRPGG